MTADYFSSFIEVDCLTSTTAKDVIIKLQVHFARYGIPSEIVSDQGPQFTSTQFHSMVNKWSIVHTMSPGHDQSSGKAEAAVKTIKHMMYKCLQDGTDVYETLLELRNTPQQDTGLSPTQLMFGRLTRTRLPAITNRPVNKKQSAMAQKRRTRKQQTVRQSYNSRARDLVPLQTGQPVYYQHMEGQRWRKGTVQSEKNEQKATLVVCTKEIFDPHASGMFQNTGPASDWQQSPGEPGGVGKSVNTAPAASSPDSEEPSSALDIPVRSQRTCRKPKWMSDYDTDF